MVEVKLPQLKTTDKGQLMLGYLRGKRKNRNNRRLSYSSGKCEMGKGSHEGSSFVITEIRM